VQQLEREVLGYLIYQLKRVTNQSKRLGAICCIAVTNIQRSAIPPALVGVAWLLS
jgi:hypothetical protein